MPKSQAVIEVLKERAGFDGFWDGCDEGIQREILEQIAAVIYSGPIVGKPVGMATILEDKQAIENFPAHEETDTR